MTELCDIDATELRRGIGARTISPVELLESCIRRIEAVNPVLNAIVATRFDEAKDEARKAEAMVMAGEPLGLLHGLPVGIKDLQDTAGLRTTYGSPIFSDHVPQEDEAMVAGIRREGGIIAGKTNTPEFGSGGNTTNLVYGTTGNAFDPVMTCGGSSGGSGVALAASMLPLCSGSDTGGSLRKPAAWSGVVGMRPSPGLVPSNRRKLGWQPLSVLGPMGRTVPDACLLLGAMLTGDSCDPFSDPQMTREMRDRFVSPPQTDLSTLRVAFSLNLGFAAVAPSIVKTFETAIGRFRHVFREAVDRDPDFTGVKEAYLVLRALNFAASYKAYYDRDPKLLGPNTRKNYEDSQRYSLSDVALAHESQTQIFRRLQRLFKDVDVLITPCQLMTPYPKDQLFPKENEGMPMGAYTDSSLMTASISMTGHPSISLPCGLDAKGLPFGLQIVGPHKGDLKMLSVAAALEKLLADDPLLRRPLPDIVLLSGMPPEADMCR